MQISSKISEREGKGHFIFLSQILNLFLFLLLLSIAPAIDIGQIEGGFVQGLGLYTLEDLVWAKDGHLRSRNVSTYKIPTYDDIPLDFRIKLRNDDSDEYPANPRDFPANRQPIAGSKAVSEAGINHAIGALIALRRAAQVFISF